VTDDKNLITFPTLLDFHRILLVQADFAVPQTSKAFNDFGNPSNNKVVFMLRTLADNKLIGFIILFKIEWNNQAASLTIGIDEPENLLSAPTKRRALKKKVDYVNRCFVKGKAMIVS
jgi:hypothetical protein